MTNKERLKRMKNSAKRIQKRSYDSDRNSFSGDGCHDRNSSESLNAAMRSVVQRSNANRRGGGGVGGNYSLYLYVRKVCGGNVGGDNI